MQTPGYVVIFSEMIHEMRMIPLDGSPHLPATVRQWNGDSRGHWEHNTLVVDTTNFNGKGWISTSYGGRSGSKSIPQSQSLHLVKRFTLVNANTIDYELTVDDPEVYTKPWKVAMPLTRDDNYKIYEYACHEGNEAVANIFARRPRFENTARPLTVRLPRRLPGLIPTVCAKSYRLLSCHPRAWPSVLRSSRLGL